MVEATNRHASHTHRFMPSSSGGATRPTHQLNGMLTASGVRTTKRRSKPAGFGGAAQTLPGSVVVHRVELRRFTPAGSRATTEESLERPAT